MTSGLHSAPRQDDPEPGDDQDQEVLLLRPAVRPGHPACLAATCAAVACAIAATSHDGVPTRPAGPQRGPKDPSSHALGLWPAATRAGGRGCSTGRGCPGAPAGRQAPRRHPRLRRPGRVPGRLPARQPRGRAAGAARGRAGTCPAHSAAPRRAPATQPWSGPLRPAPAARTCRSGCLQSSLQPPDRSPGTVLGSVRRPATPGPRGVRGCARCRCVRR
jgi:hypothetical protein